jgi:hypothetical protein
MNGLWRVTLDDFSNTSGNSDSELTEVVGRVQDLVRKRGVRVFKLEYISQCTACSGTGRCSDVRCYCMSDQCAECGGTGQA